MRPLDWALLAIAAVPAVCFVVTLALLIRELGEFARERARLLHAVLARDPREYATLQRIERKPKAGEDDEHEKVSMIGLGG